MSNNPFGGPTSMIQKFMGTAYDIVKTVYDNLALLQLFENDINRHQISATAPTTRADGSALQTGDTCFDGSTFTYTWTDQNQWELPFSSQIGGNGATFVGRATAPLTPATGNLRTVGKFRVYGME